MDSQNICLLALWSVSSHLQHELESAKGPFVACVKDILPHCGPKGCRLMTLTSHIMKTLEKYNQVHLMVKPQMDTLGAEDNIRFSTIRPAVLVNKLKAIKVAVSLVTWIVNYLPSRRYCVRL